MILDIPLPPIYFTMNWDHYILEYVSYSLNSLKGVIKGDCIGDYYRGY